MTKKLNQVFNIPENQPVIEAEVVKKSTDKKSTDKISNSAAQAAQAAKQKRQKLRALEEFDKITKALPLVHGLGQMADDELDAIAEKAIKSYEDLMDLGMNVESRYSTRMFEVAGSMLKTGLDAKVAKLDKKLKMVDLQLKKQKIDGDTVSEGKFTEGSGFLVSDRNSLIERLKNVDNDK
jgi:hypothetical protein